MDSNHRRHSQQIYSLPHLATLVTTQKLSFRASCRIRTNDPEITNHVLWPTELKRQILAAILRLKKEAVVKRLQRYDYFLEPPKFFVIFLVIAHFFFKFGQLNLHCIHCQIYSFLKSVAYFLDKEFRSWYCDLQLNFLVHCCGRLHDL